MLVNVLRIRFKISDIWNQVSGSAALSRKLNQLYSKRDWEAFDGLMTSHRLPHSLKLIWRAMQVHYFHQMQEPVEEWGKVCFTLTKRGHYLAPFAHQNYLNAIIASGDLNLFKEEFPKQFETYGVALPINSVGSACALYLLHDDYIGCTRFLNHFHSSLRPAQRALFSLKSFPYAWLSSRASEASIASDTMLEGLECLMTETFALNSPARAVFDACNSCWKAIAKQEEVVLKREIRYDPTERKQFQAFLLEALKKRQPLMFMRIGDGESYAFSNDATNSLSNFRLNLEHLWWGCELNAELRTKLMEQVRNTIASADIIGLPSLPRLSQVLHRFEAGALPEASRKQLGLFTGIESMIADGAIACKFWVDEYANFTLFPDSALQELVEYSANVVVVGCFEIPAGHILNHPKVTVLHIPPAKKVSEAAGVVNESGILPERLAELNDELTNLLGPGSLLLLSAGFAGKPLLATAKKNGAVALDFGSALDVALGYQTRSPELTYLFSRDL
jgi:hypothetical protein